MIVMVRVEGKSCDRCGCDLFMRAANFVAEHTGIKDGIPHHKMLLLCLDCTKKRDKERYEQNND